MRYKRIEHILTKDKAISERLSQPSEAVMKPNGQQQLFAKEVVEVTERLHEQGIDPQNANRRFVLQTAIAVFNGVKRKPAAKAPEPPPAPVPKAKTAKAKSPKAPKAPKVKAAPRRRRRESATAAKEDAPAAASAPAAPPSVDTRTKVVAFPFQRLTSLSETEFLPTEALKLSLEGKKKVMGMQLVVTLLLFAANSAEAVDGLPGNAERLAALSKVLASYSKLNTVDYLKEEPSAKEAVQPQPATAG